MNTGLVGALQRLGAVIRLEQHEAEVEHTIECAQTNFTSRNKLGVVLALPSDLPITGLLRTYDTLSLGKKCHGKTKTLSTYEVVARIDNGRDQTIVAFCS